MNTDLLPAHTFAPESSSSTSRRIGKGHTLTLPLDLTPVHTAGDAMGGTVSFDDIGRGRGRALRAAVVPAVGSGLTITF